MSKPASSAQIGFIRSLLSARTEVLEITSVDDFIAANRVEELTSSAASELITKLKAMPTYVAVAANDAAATSYRPNGFAAKCVKCGVVVPAREGRLEGAPGRWETYHVGPCPEVVVAAPASKPSTGIDLTPLLAYTSRNLVRFGVPGGDTRLKLRIKLASNGSIYVDDAAVYGEGRHYGSQRPGEPYKGDVADALTAILADPQAAMIRYAELTGHCAICSRKLERAESVAAGMGPVCSERAGL